MRKYTQLICLATMLLGFACNSVKKTEEVKLTDDERMEWWRDARFGMFIHWGAYSMLGGEYQDSICWGGAEWVMDKLDMTIEEYEKYPRSFNPVDFNAEKWVSLAKNAGMKYIVLTSKHHDGFCLWDSKVTDYDIMDTSPFKRDIIREMAEECKKQGIVFCLYHSITDWHHPQAQSIFYPDYNIGQKDQTKSNPEFPKYFKNYLKPQVGELLSNYGDIGVIWFDGEWIADYTTEMGKEMYDYILDLQPNTIVNNRVDKGRNGMAGFNVEGNFVGDFGTPEKEVPATGIDEDWEACFTMNGSWGYKPSDLNWKSDTLLIQSLVDIVSKGGNFLLNIGPDGLGNVPEESVVRLNTMGEWMKENEEAIYGAKASPFEKPEWGVYTSKGNVVYAHVFDWPEDGKLPLNEKVKVKSATLLASSGSNIEWVEGALQLPVQPTNKFVSVVKIVLDQEQPL
ncbi:alpha-L-fucosidase [Flammeovirga sp. SJP92]|uniref:alpha-L-fucosidase n=2 Tax=Flammeovirga sp. SJP92 TaxID=1775430 RepID=UPI0007877E11|nr:alpha-L-fucosidase [Flammeovirga sp. SJP92]KXX71094.1 alpha-L-fucosidase [Flammeovirga sp. SJP92]